MNKCWWCHKDGSTYAFGLCLSCYRWFLRAAKNPPLRCTVCEVVISRKHEDDLLCVSCRKEMEQSLTKPKRISHMEDKYDRVTTFLESLAEYNLNPETQLTAIFTFKNRKLAKIIYDRFFNKKTLHEIGLEYNVSREYIRQCEDKALKMLTDHMNGVVY